MESQDEHPATQHPPKIGNLRKTHVQMHPMNPVEAYVSPQRWNGWMRPFFTPQQAERFAEEFEGAWGDSSAEYDPERDAWLIDSPERTEPDIYPAVTRFGQTFYPIGAGIWVWSEPNDLDDVIH